jgi:hemerythrin-like domain-containing protein
MQATEVLKHEHQVILHVLDAAEREARYIEAHDDVHGETVEKMVDFFRNFADRCHHAKEEDLLFVKMEERGIPTNTGPIAVMLEEHEMGRAHLKAIADARAAAEQGDAEALTEIKRHLLGYVALLRDHIYKEDNILYPLADEAMTEKDQEVLNEAFDRVESEEIGEGVHERYHAMAHELMEG